MRAVIVDDESPALRLMSELLEEHGVEETYTFQSPRDALKWLKTEKAEVIFLDIEMPGMDGITFANHLLDQGINIPVVFVTAYSEYAVEAFRLNALDYVLKPVEKERLHRTLKRLSGISSFVEPERISIKCFGRFYVDSSTGVAVHWRTTKAEELFAYLVNWGSRGAVRERILEALWPDFDADRALVHLNTTLYNVRRALTGMGIANIILYEQGRYRLLMDNLYCDLWQFEEGIASLKNITSDNIKMYDDILSLYTGGYLEQNYYSWTRVRWAALQEAYFDLNMLVCRYYMENGNYKRAVSLIKKALDYEPLSRELNQMLVHIYYKMKDVIAAKCHIDSFRRRFRAEFKEEPEPL